MSKHQRRDTPEFRQSAIGLVNEQGYSHAEEFKQLRKEVQRLRMENEILKKAAAYFAKERL